MSEERKLILQMVADGKISADEAEKLLQALDETERSAQEAATREMHRTANGPAFGEGIGRKAESLGDTVERTVGESLRALDGALRHLEINLESKLGAKNRDDLRTSVEEKIRRSVERSVEQARRSEERVREAAERAEQRVRENATRLEERAREQASRMEERARRMADRAREAADRAERHARHENHPVHSTTRIVKAGIAIDKEAVEKDATLTLAAEPSDTLVMENRVGDIRVAFYEGDEIEVAVRKQAWGEDREDATVRADATEISLVREGAVVRVQVARPTIAGVGIIWIKDTRLDFTVRVPHGTNLKLNSKAGDVVVVGGDQVGQWNLESKVGDVDVKVAPGAGFSYDLQSEHGAVRVTLAGHEPTQVEYPDRKGTVMIGKVNEGDGRIEVRSKTGDLRLMN